MSSEPINPINPNEEATPDPRIETQRYSREATVLTYDDVLPIDSDDEGLVTSDGDTTRPVPSLQDEEIDEENPTGEDHFYEVAPTDTSVASATQQIEEDVEEDQ
jgi:hypothetical protein